MRKKSAVLILDKLAFYIFLVTGALLPLVTWPSARFSLEFIKISWWQLGLGLALLLWLVAALVKRRLAVPSGILWWAIDGLLLISLISALATGPWRSALLGGFLDLGTWGAFLALAFSIFIAAVIINTPRRFFLFYLALAGSWLLLFLVQLAQVLPFTQGKLDWLGLDGNGASNLLGRWNELALLAGLVLVLAVAALEFLDFSQSRPWRFLVWTVLMSALVTLIFINFSAAWCLVGVMMILLIARRLIAGDLRVWRNWFPSLPAIIFLVAVLLIVSNFIFSAPTDHPLTKLQTALQVSSLEVRPSFSTTFGLLRATLADSGDSVGAGGLWLGAGPNRFVNQWLKFKPPGVNLTDFWNNDFNAGFSFWLTFIINTGLLGLLALIVFGAVFLFYGWRLLFQAVTPFDISEAKEIPDTSLSQLAWFGAFYLWLLLFVYVPTTALLVLTFVFIGLWSAALAQDRLVKLWVWPKPRSHFSGLTINIVLAVPLIVFLILGAVRLRQGWSWWLYQRALATVNRGGDTQSAESDLQRAAALSPNDLYYRAQTELGLLKLRQLAAARPAPADLAAQFQALVEPTLASARQAITIDGANYNNWLTLGRLYGLLALAQVEGASVEAEKAYQNAEVLNPQNPSLWLDAARLALSLSDPTAARANAQTALEKKPNWPPALLLVGQLRYEDKDYAGAVEVLKSAVELAPNYSDARYFLGLSYKELGERDLALAEFQILARLNPGNAEVERILTDL